MSKKIYSGAEDVAYEEGVLDALALMEEELHGFVEGLDREMLEQVKARVSARLIGDTN